MLNYIGATALQTEFASARRASFGDLGRQAGLFSGNEFVSLLDSVTDMVFVVNDCRQIVYANERLRVQFGVTDIDILGARPGELFRCGNAEAAVTGCGTTHACRHCGAVNAILTSLEGEPSENDYRIQSHDEDDFIAYDLHVQTTPLAIDGEKFVVTVVSDVSNEKRRRALERTFFHDILNTAGGIRNLLALVSEDAPESLQDELQMLERFSGELVEEITAHKVLLAAETHELGVDPQVVDPVVLLQRVQTLYMSHQVAEGISLVMGECEGHSLVTDGTLLRRVVANMVKNALEASSLGDVVTLGHEREGSKHVFWVHNAGEIPVAARTQIFARSFSTKGSGRGLGTYSMRLLTQNYLQGQVVFSTSQVNGTCFRVVLPEHLQTHGVS